MGQAVKRLFKGGNRRLRADGFHALTKCQGRLERDDVRSRRLALAVFEIRATGARPPSRTISLAAPVGHTL
jgi:hypothetical protein